jgi:serine protease
LNLRGHVAGLLAGVLWFAGGTHASPPESVAKSGTSAELPVTSLIVRFAGSKGPVPFAPAARARVLADAAGAMGATVAHARILASGADLVRLDKAFTRTEAEALAVAVSRLPGVVYAVPNRVVQTQAVPTDPKFANAGQWGFKYVPGSVEGANFVGAWDITVGSPTQTIGIVDSGIARSHEELVTQLRTHPAFPNGGYDFVTEAVVGADGSGRDDDPQQGPVACGHGSHVAGTIAAQTSFAHGPTSIGVAGGASWSKILMARALGDQFGSDADAIDAMLWLAGEPVAGVAVNPNPVRMINMSFGGAGACGGAYQDAFDILLARGVLPVVAAGNSYGANVSTSAPANCRGAVAVAASDSLGARANFSNLGAGVAITAPGVDVESTGGLTTGSCFKSGTSMAAPHVTAAAALLQAALPTLTASQTRLALRAGARPFPPTSNCTTELCGAGLLDVRGALDAVTSGGVRVGWNEQAATVRENDGNAIFTVSRIGDAAQAASVSVVALPGTAVLGQDYAAPSPAILTWAANDSSDKVVTVPIIYRPGEQVARSVPIQLVSANPAIAVAAPSSVTVRITEVDCGVVTPINYGDTKSGTLDVLQPGNHCRGGVRGPEFNTARYSFNGTVGDVITVEVNSTAAPPAVLDPYVYLLDSNRRVLAENDDIVSGKLRDSRIQLFQLTSTGTHYIDVTTWGISADATGSYELKLTRCGSYAGGATCNLDADGDAVFDARDAQLMLRRLAGFKGAALTEGTTSPRACAARVTATDVAAFVDSQSAPAIINKSLDIDGDGVVLANTDGLMLLRVALGLVGDAVVANATTPGAPRTTWALVKPYLVNQCGLVLP